MTLHGCGKNWGLATSGGNGHHTVLEMFSLSVVWRTFHAMPSGSATGSRFPLIRPCGHRFRQYSSLRSLALEERPQTQAIAAKITVQTCHLSGGSLGRRCVIQLGTTQPVALPSVTLTKPGHWPGFFWSVAVPSFFLRHADQVPVGGSFGGSRAGTAQLCAKSLAPNPVCL